VEIVAAEMLMVEKRATNWTLKTLQICKWMVQQQSLAVSRQNLVPQAMRHPMLGFACPVLIESVRCSIFGLAVIARIFS
jgi:hypothetical protein